MTPSRSWHSPGQLSSHIVTRPHWDQHSLVPVRRAVPAQAFVVWFGSLTPADVGLVLALHRQHRLVVWLAVAFAFRFSSLAAIVASIAIPPLGFYFLGNWPEAWALIPIALLLVWRHRANIRKLLAGNEAKIGA